MNKEKALLFTLAVIQFSHITDFMILMPLGPQLMDAFSIKPAQFALLVSTYTISAGISGFVGAFFIDRFDRRKALIITASGFALGTLLCSFSYSYEMLLATRSFTGMFGGVLGALILAIIGDAIPNERRAGAMGMVMAAFSAASVFGVPAGLFLASISDWHLPFLILGIIASLTLIPIIRFIPQMTRHIDKCADNPTPLEIIQKVTSNGNQMKALLFGMIIMFSHFTIIPFISPYMVANVGFTEQQITYIYLIGGGLTIFTAPLIGRLADRHGRVKVFTIVVLAASIPVYFMTTLGETPVALMLVVTSLFFIFGSGRFIPSTAMITSSVLPQNRGSFMSFNSASRQLANGIAAYLGGLIIAEGPNGELINYDYVGYFAIGMGLISILLSRKIKSVD
jgi:predicted MFS family arabinose efflux permease